MIWYGEDFESDLLDAVVTEIKAILTAHGVTVANNQVIKAPVNQNAIPAESTFAMIQLSNSDLERTDWTQMGEAEDASSVRRRWGYRSAAITLEIYRSDSPKWMQWIANGFVSPDPVAMVRRDNAGFLSIRCGQVSNIDMLDPNQTATIVNRRATINVTFGMLVESSEESLQTVSATTEVDGMPVQVEVTL